MSAPSRWRPLRWFGKLILAVVLLAIMVLPSQARMGGGHSYSGGSSRSSSSSSSSSRSSGSSSRSSSSGSGWGGSWGGGSTLSGSSRHSYTGGSAVYAGNSSDSDSNAVMVLEIIVLILVLYLLWRLLSSNSLHTSAQTFQGQRRPPVSPVDIDRQITALKAEDDQFSRVLLLDFASVLYHKYYSYRGTAAFNQVQPFMAKTVLDEAASAGPCQVRDIVIGQARICSVAPSAGEYWINVEFESNFTAHYPSGESSRLINRERWVLTRQRGVLSPSPEQMRSLSCPSCGAPADFTDAGECQYCHRFITAGQQQWQVTKIRIINTELFTLDNPAAYVEEAGTELPTLQQANLSSQQQAFIALHGLSDWAGFFEGFSQQIVKPYFHATYSAWSHNNWAAARHLVSDRLYAANNFWMQQYARQGWQNRLDHIEIQQIVPVRMDLDKFYEALTVRVYARCLDYTVDRRGKVIGGSNSKPRRFSEYWTFIRTAGVEKIDKPYDLKTCPSCGAPADKVGQAGNCGYCGAKLSEGHFSWVLAVISQDEVYQG